MALPKLIIFGMGLTGILLILLGSGFFISGYIQSQSHLQDRIAQQHTSKVQLLGKNTQSTSKLIPSHLFIPAIQVVAAVENVGITNSGVMAVPEKINDAGWFELGAQPGEKGSAVIAGHYNGFMGQAGVFNRLNQLKPSDQILVDDNQGNRLVFEVRETKTYNPGYADQVFSQNDAAHLNLITCDGTWDSIKRNYTKRLVVFADLQK